MPGLFEILRQRKPKVAPSSNGRPSDIPDNLWAKCGKCGTPAFHTVFAENLKVCAECGHHHKLTCFERLQMLQGDAPFERWDEELKPGDPLKFSPDYLDKLARDQNKTGLNDAILTGQGQLDDIPIALGIMDFHFRGGSMGSVVGEKVARLMEEGARRKLPVVLFTSSGGARMQEGMFSLMQMAKTCATVNVVNQARVPYIVVLTDPTTAGVAASFASLGDVILAEPGAIIGFSGARVIEQTIRQKLPPGFQTSEFYLEHGFIDSVVHRKDIRETLIRLLRYLV